MVQMTMNALLYEGKAKRVYQGADDATCLIFYKDTATALNGAKKAEISDKGRLNCAISTTIFKFLAAEGISTHFLDTVDDNTILAQKVEIIPLEVIVRNVAAGSFAQRFGVVEGTPLQQPTLEFCYKNDQLGDPLLNKTHILALDLADADELETIVQLSGEINRLLCGFFAQRQLELIDFKIEFGRCGNTIILADEITPDCCRLWDATTKKSLDKDRFRRDQGQVIEAYQEVFRRVCSR